MCGGLLRIIVWVMIFWLVLIRVWFCELVLDFNKGIFFLVWKLCGFLFFIIMGVVVSFERMSFCLFVKVL